MMKLLGFAATTLVQESTVSSVVSRLTTTFAGRNSGSQALVTSGIGALRAFISTPLGGRTQSYRLLTHRTGAFMQAVLSNTTSSDWPSPATSPTGRAKAPHCGT